MSLKAGRVGVAKDQVDDFGNIKTEATSGYSKQEADAKFETQTAAAEALALKQSKVLEVPIEMLSGSKLTVESALHGLNVEKFERAEQRLLGAKNLLNVNKNTEELSGVLFTVNRNDHGEVISIDVSGTCGNNDVYFNLKDKTKEFLSGAYIFSDGVANENIGVVVEGYNGSTWATNFGGTSFTGKKNFVIDYSNYDSITLLIRVKANTVISDTVRLYPMLRLASDPDDTYTPYFMTNRVLTEKVQGIVDAATDAADFSAFKTAIANL